jgi:transaldolase
MKFFIDTANIEQIREAASMGLLDGVTTNPSLLAMEAGKGQTSEEILKEICKIVDGPISAEVVAEDFEGMMREGRVLAAIHDNIVVKVPVTMDGIKAVQAFKSEGIKNNVTLIFSPTQALLAAKAGAAFVSPFVGRVDDISHSGMEIVEQIIQIFDNYDVETEVLVASIRHPVHVVEAALMGADVATMPFKVISQLVKHPLTDVGIERFRSDWENANK